MPSEMFKECIADAKAAKAAALANAKASLVEAFTPRLQSMLGEKLRNELADEENEVAPTDITGSEEVTSEEINAILQELGTEVNEADELPPVDAAPADAAPVTPPVDVASDAAAAPVAPGAIKTVEAPVMVVAPGQAPALDAPVGDAPVGDAPVGDAPVGDAPVGDAPANDDNDEINLEELLQSLEEGSVEEDQTHVSETNLSEIVADINERKKTKGEKKKDDEKDEDNRPPWLKEEELQEVKKQFNEACETVKFLQGQLKEVNLLNAKWMYANKIFKSTTLNNPQKMKIVEAFDLAKSVREVKLTFNNLTEALNLSKVKNVPQRQAITEGFSSKSVGTTKPADNIVVAPVNEMATRFQKLAGIKLKTV